MTSAWPDTSGPGLRKDSRYGHLVADLDNNAANIFFLLEKAEEEWAMAGSQSAKERQYKASEMVSVT